MKTSIKRTLLSTLVVPFALGVQSASAELITEWGYSVDSNFSNVMFGAGGSNGETTVDLDGNGLSWGSDTDENERSSVSITDVDFPGGGLFTNVNTVAGGVFTHDNQTISADFETLSSFDLMSTLTLTQVDPAGPLEVSPPPLLFMNFFSETLNAEEAGDCGFPSATACDDIFVIDNFDDLGGEFEFSQSFDFDGYEYTVFLELSGLAALDEDTCIAAGGTAGCVGLVTPEDAQTSFGTSLSITAQKVQVPEPGTLALLGLGLAGLGLSRRKKAAKA